MKGLAVQGITAQNSRSQAGQDVAGWLGEMNF